MCVLGMAGWGGSIGCGGFSILTFTEPEQIPDPGSILECAIENGIAFIFIFVFVFIYEFWLEFWLEFVCECECEFECEFVFEFKSDDTLTLFIILPLPLPLPFILVFMFVFVFVFDMGVRGMIGTERGTVGGGGCTSNCENTCVLIPFPHQLLLSHQCES